MHYSLCTRTNDQDYAWLHSTPETIKARECAEFFDGGVGDIFAVLYCLPICSNNLTLGISVPTTRRDNHGRVIRSMAMLSSGNTEDDAKLVSFYSCILQTEDQGGLKNAEGDIASAIEEIVTTKGKSFEKFNKVCAVARLSIYGDVIRNKKAIPQADICERKNVAKELALISKSGPFFIAITYKKPTDIVEKFQLLSAAVYARIFSSQCAMAETITISRLSNIDRRYVVGGVLLLIGICILLSLWRTRKEEKETLRDVMQAPSNIIHTVTNSNNTTISSQQ